MRFIISESRIYLVLFLSAFSITRSCSWTTAGQVKYSTAAFDSSSVAVAFAIASLSIASASHTASSICFSFIPSASLIAASFAHSASSIDALFCCWAIFC